VFPLHVLHVSIGFNMFRMLNPLMHLSCSLNNVLSFEVSNFKYLVNVDIIIFPLGHFYVTR